MQDSPFDKLYQSISYPEQSFDLYLRPRNTELQTFSEELNGYKIPPAFSEPLIDFLYKVEKKSGFARLHIETEIVRQGPKLVVKWESGTSERGFLTETEYQALQHLARSYFRNQMSKYGFTP